MRIDYGKIARDLILNEEISTPDIHSYIQALAEILGSVKPYTIREKRRIEVAKSHLNEIKRKVKYLTEEIQTLNEQIRILEEKKRK